MAPQRGRGNKGVLPVSQTLKSYDVQNQDDIDDSLLRKLYRLEDSVAVPRVIEVDEDDDPIEASDDEHAKNGSRRPDAAVPAIHPFKACSPLWTGGRLRNDLHLPDQSPRASLTGQRAVTDSKNGCHDDGGSTTAKRKLAYKLRPICSCSKDACKENPRCLNWLGQAEWEDTPAALARFKKRLGAGDDPALALKDPFTPVGLRNLGATCYANSFLQVWFQDEVFRRGVFACLPSGTVPHEKQPMFQLQVIFAALQSGNAKAFNPVDLVRSLRLDTGEQQDAQEFAKLFMDVLDKEFKKQAPQSGLRELVHRQFEGTVLYGTQCARCKTKSERREPFKELALTLKSGKTLETLIADSLRSERLAGDNRYFCDHCRKLQEADRYTEIVALPPVLHFSLLRFVFDPKTADRKKTSAMITIPASIEMGQFLGDGETIDEAETWYDLKGILLHRGPSAHHGHYVAHIYDSRYSRWFMFDDETVRPQALAPLKKDREVHKTSATVVVSDDSDREDVSSEMPVYASSKNGIGSPKPTVIRNVQGGRESDVHYVSDSDDGPWVQSSSTSKVSGQAPCKPSEFFTEEGSAAAHARSRKRPKVEDDEDAKESKTVESSAQDVVIRSKDAYMLVYHRRNSTASTTKHTAGGSFQVGQNGNPESLGVQVPAAALAKVEAIDTENAKSGEDFRRRMHDISAQFEELREQKRSVYTVWQDCEDDEDACLVSASELERWLLAELQPAKKATKAVPPLAPSASNPAPTEAALTDITSIERDPAEANSVQGTAVASNGAHSDSVAVNGHSRDAGSHTEATGDRLAPDSAVVLGASNGKSRSQSSSSSPQPAQTTSLVSGPDRDTFLLDSSKYACRHGRLSPAHAGDVKRISQPGMFALHDLGVHIEPCFTTQLSLCRDCLWEPEAERGYTLRHRKEIQDFKAQSKGHGGARWISRAWLDDWLKDKPRNYDSSTNTALSPGHSTFAGHVLCTCPRRMLQPDESLRSLVTASQVEFLSQIFPDCFTAARDAEICPMCRLGYERRNQDLQKSLQQAKKEKVWAFASGSRVLPVPDVAESVANLTKADPGLKGLRTRSALFPRGDYCPNDSEEECSAIPLAWFGAWSWWLNKPADPSRRRPGGLDLGPFFCEHGLANVNLNVPADKEKFVVVSEAEWDAFLKYYRNPSGLQLVVRQVAAGSKGKYAQIPPVCDSCRDRVRHTFEAITISVCQIQEEDLGPDGLPSDSIVETYCSSTTSKSERSVSPIDVKGPAVRRSMRARKTPGSSNEGPSKRRTAKFGVGRFDTLKEIRVEISDRLGIPIILQRVFYRAREIEDVNETIESIGITDRETLFVYEIPQNNSLEDFSQLEDVVVVGSRRTRSSNGESKRRGRSTTTETGFQGTGLHGFDSFVDVDQIEDTHTIDPQDQAANIAAAMPGQCSTCTFLNEPALLQCEMCGNEI